MSQGILLGRAVQLTWTTGIAGLAEAAALEYSRATEKGWVRVSKKVCASGHCTFSCSLSLSLSVLLDPERDIRGVRRRESAVADGGDHRIRNVRSVLEGGQRRTSEDWEMAGRGMRRLVGAVAPICALRNQRLETTLQGNRPTRFDFA
eukprot:3518703-Rhodomonas_salina.2